MKKFMTLAAMFAAVMISFSACEPTVDPAPTPTVCPDCGEDPCVCEAPYVSPITIDGNFDDWAALTNAVTATCAPDHSKPALKTLKAYADENFLHVFVEWDEENVPTYDPDGANPLMLCFCGNPENGGYNAWEDMCVEYMCYTQPLDETGAFTTWNDAVYAWTGEIHAEGWSWDTALDDLKATGMGSGNKYEIAIMMPVLNSIMELDGELRLGAMQQLSWNAMGVLPNAEVTDENPTGVAPMMVVPIN